MKKRDYKFYLTILNELKNSTNLKNIQKKYNLSKQNLHYYLRRLQKDNLILNKGYGHWEVITEVKNQPGDTQPKKDSIRGHAFIWQVKIPKEIGGWDNRIKILERAGIKFKLIGAFKKTPRIIVNNKKVWLGNKTITIYDSCSFYGKDAIESRKYAVITLLETVYKLERKLKISLAPYQFKPTREHYGQIKNDLAIHCNRKGEKIHIRDEMGTEWLWIDDSLSLGELETDKIKNSKMVQNWWNDHKKNNFEVSPTFILQGFSKVLKIQRMHSENIVKHQKVLDEMLITLKKIQESLT